MYVVENLQLYVHSASRDILTKEQIKRSVKHPSSDNKNEKKKYATAI